jgi:CubicO group peptidase (beta-lactamase class C family)
VESGRTVLAKGYGLANREWNAPNGPDTKFRIASMSKAFTAVLVLQQVRAGKLKLEGHISDYLPWYRRDTGGVITIHQLLTNSSGLPEYWTADEAGARLLREPVASVKDFVIAHCSGNPRFPPGSRFEYSNSGYSVLGLILEEVTGKPYEQLLREGITGPLAMNDTGFDHNEAVLPRRAAGYGFSGLANAPYIDMSVPYSAGALYSTVEDLARWDRALYGEKLLPARLRAVLFTPNRGDYACGWFVTRPDKRIGTLMMGEGGISGFATRIVRLTDRRHAVVLLANQADAPIHALTDGIVRILVGDAPPARLPFGERQLNRLGYQLLLSDRVDDAIAILELNAEVYPASANVHDSLGEALARKGDKARAIRSYARSLELDPDNLNAVQALGRLTRR